MTTRSSLRKPRSGCTLIELLSVFGLLGALALLADLEMADIAVESALTGHPSARS